jgi:thiol:disulfide interchange protein DsbC
MKVHHCLVAPLLLFAAGLLALPAVAQEATIRKNLAARMPQLAEKIDEVSKTPIPGLYEIRIGTDILYSDAEGNHLIQGSLFDTRSRTDLTEERVGRLTAIDMDKLPLKDAMVVKQGNGKRQLVVFADPHCGYCKQLERDLVKLKDVTIYTFLYPILGPRSTEDSRAIWCTKDAQATWRGWMIDGKPAPRLMGTGCDASAIERNVAFGRKHKITATPALVFADGRRVAGALTAADIDKRMNEIAPVKPKS